ncbi:MAG: hypothetical protein U5J99_08025 [Parvularculaceae bacterium]|nr:hypothetical protein [Parvularculaceae bacterium]
MKKVLLAVAVSAFGLTACATSYAPRYQQARTQSDAGYFDTRIDQNRYRVQYRVSSGDPQLAQDWVFRRAAELTLKNRYDWFQVLSRSRDLDDNVFQRYESTRYNYDDRSGDERPPYGDYGDQVAIIEVVMGENPPPRASNVFDASRVLDQNLDRR